MTESKISGESPKSDLPARNVRISWWLFIYLAGSIPLVIEVLFNIFNSLMLAAPLFFPMYLGFLIGGLLAHPLPESFEKPLFIFGIVAGYGFYIWHFRQTLRQKHAANFVFGCCFSLSSST